MQQIFSSLNSERSELSSSVIVTDSSDELEKTNDFFAFFYVFQLFAFFLVLSDFWLFVFISTCLRLLNGFLTKRTKFATRRYFSGVEVITSDFFFMLSKTFSR